MVGEGVFEDAEDGGGGEVAVFAEGLPTKGEGVFGEAEGLLGGFEDLGSAGVEDPGFDVGESERLAADALLVGEEGLYVAADVFKDDLGNVGGEDDFEARVADVPAHDVLGVAVEGAAGG